MAFKHFGFVLGGLLLAGTACSHSAGMTRNSDNGQMSTGMASATPGTIPDSIARQKDAIMSQADGAQPGRVRDFSGNTLTLDSQSTTAGGGGTMTMRLDNNIPVFQGAQRVSTDALVPGADVRVFYKNPANGSYPKALAVEVLGSSNSNTPSDNGSTSPSSNTTTPSDNSNTPSDNGSTSPSGNTTTPSDNGSTTPNDNGSTIRRPRGGDT
jgi:hypothetical protein